VRSVVANVAPVNVSDTKVNEDRACNCSVLGGLRVANAQMPQPNIMKELANGPQVAYFSSRLLSWRHPTCFYHRDCHCWAELQHTEPHRMRPTLSNQSIRTEGAETLAPDLLESAMEELFKTVWCILSTVVVHCRPILLGETIYIVSQKRPLLYFE